MSDVTRWTIFSLLDPEFIDNIRIAVVFGSSAHEAVIVTKDDKVFGLGSNANNCLGLGNGCSSLEPVCIDPLCGRNIVHIATGSGPHMLALSDDGQVFSWSNQLGNGSLGFTPSLVSANLSNIRVVQIACGTHHSMALTEEGDVFAWGQNSSGQVGSGTNAAQPTPRKVSGLLNGQWICLIVCGQTSSFALSAYGELFSWGYNGNGQLGLGNNTNQYLPCKVQENLDSKKIRQVVCGYAHAMGVTDEGELYAWGSNSCGQLGNGSRTNQLAPIRTGIQLGRIMEVAASHSCNISAVITQGNKVYMWGQCRGQTILEPQETRFSRLDDVFACFAHPPVSWRPLNFASVNKHNVKESIKHAFDDAATADVTFMVDNKPIYAHRAILKIRCHHFRTMLQHGMWSEGQKDDRVDMSPEDALGLLDLANSYCEPELKLKCADVIKSGINVENAVLLYAAAVRYEALDLEDFCFRFCLNHLTAVIQGEAFQRLDEGTMRQLIIQAAKCGAFKH